MTARNIDRLSHDVREAFPDMRGFSPRNLKYMRAFAAAWPEREIVQRTVAQIPWRSNLALLHKLDIPETRIWYARKAIEQGWSREIHEILIRARMYERQGNAVTNFPGRCRRPTPIWPRRRSRTRTCSTSSAPPSRARNGSSSSVSWTTSSASCWRWGPDSPLSAR